MATKKEQMRAKRLKSIVKTVSKDGVGVVGQIISAYKKGFSKQELIKVGKFNKNTVYRQTREADLA